MDSSRKKVEDILPPQGHLQINWLNPLVDCLKVFKNTPLVEYSVSDCRQDYVSNTKTIILVGFESVWGSGLGRVRKCSRISAVLAVGHYNAAMNNNFVKAVFWLQTYKLIYF